MTNLQAQFPHIPHPLKQYSPSLARRPITTINFYEPSSTTPLALFRQSVTADEVSRRLRRQRYAGRLARMLYVARQLPDLLISGAQRVALWVRRGANGGRLPTLSTGFLHSK